jgi:TM2 domain-containing membrane protein YozV
MVGETHKGGFVKGHILAFSVQTNSGDISGDDGARYVFSGTDWNGSSVPHRGLVVDFEAEGNQARSVYPAVGTSTPGSKSKVAAGVLAILLGGIGIHKFYLGYTGPGLVYLLINTVGLALTWLLVFIPNYALAVVAMVEGIIYLTKSDAEFEQTYVIGKRPWF